MGRKPKQPQSEGPSVKLSDVDASKRKYWRDKLAQIREMWESAAAEGKTLPGHKQAIDALIAEAKLDGVDLSQVADARTDAMIAYDTIKEIAAMPEELFSQLDHKLDNLLLAMEEANRLCIDELESRKLGLRPEEVSQFEAKGKALKARIEKVRKARMWARVPVDGRVAAWRKDGVEAAHILRFMLYVGRTQTPDLGYAKTDLFRFGPHHALMAVELWITLNGVEIIGGKCLKNRKMYEGLILVMAPGTGKTEFGAHFAMLRAAKNPELQGIMLHSKRDRAQKVLQYVADSFSRSNPSGRRLRSLYPDVELADKDNTAHSMRLKTKKLMKEPTWISHGVGAAASGSNATDIYIDDPVDQREAHQPATREHVKTRIGGTWLARRRGSNSFTLWIATLWHEDDATSDMIRKARQGKSDFRVVLRGHGGPNEGFKSVWPESNWTPARLRREFQTLGPQQYMTIYGCKPTSETTAIVESLALYPAVSPAGLEIEQHQDFLAKSRFHISIDPAATVTKNADRTGIVYVASGNLASEIDVDGRPAIQRTPRARVVSAMRLKAVSTEVIGELGRFIGRHPVHEVHIEVAGGFYAMAEYIENELGIAVVRHQTSATRSKEYRLKSVQMMLENNRKGGGGAATVEFPGQWRESTANCPDHPDTGFILEDHKALCPVCRKKFNTLEPASEIEWLVDEILRFGGAVSDDGVDAVTQICEHLKGELGIGESAITVQKRSIREGFQSRISSFLGKSRQKRGSFDYAEAENRWHAATYE